MPRTKAAKKKTVAIVNKKATEQGLREFQEEGSKSTVKSHD